MSALSLPSIWTPAASRPHDAMWWTNHLRGLRDRLTLWTAGKRQKNAAGRWVKHRGNGKVAKHTATNSNCGCTCNQPCKCTLCSNGYPCGVTLTGADIDYTLCDDACISPVTAGRLDFDSTGAASAATHSSMWTTVLDTMGGGPNGVFDIAGHSLAAGDNWGTAFGDCNQFNQADAGGCVWGIGGFSTTDYHIGTGPSQSFGGDYGDESEAYVIIPLLGPTTSCRSPVGIADNVGQLSFGWQLVKTALKWTCANYCLFNVFTVTDASGGSGLGPFTGTQYRLTYYRFYSELDTTEDADCSQTLTFTNQLTGCAAFSGKFDGICGSGGSFDPNGGVSVGSGGTAVVVFTTA